MKLTGLTIKALQKGNTDAFRILCEYFFPSLYALATQWGISSMAAEVIVQDVFGRFYRDRHHFSEIIALKAYLYTKVYAVCLKSVIESKKYKFPFIALHVGFVDEEWFVLMEKSMCWQLECMWQELPEPAGIVLEHLLQGLTPEESAAELGRPISWVKICRRKNQQILRRRYPWLFMYLEPFLPERSLDIPDDL